MTHPTETDRELLELAAKAVNGGAWHPLTHATPHGKDWTPLTDDGDALRLAVTLVMGIVVDSRTRKAAANVDEGPYVIQQWEEGGDPYAATRRAIVRAAAEIGRAMK